VQEKDMNCSDHSQEIMLVQQTSVSLLRIFNQPVTLKDKKQNENIPTFENLDF
jgi:hypothetical protein